MTTRFAGDPAQRDRLRRLFAARRGAGAGPHRVPGAPL